jgi:hypothetical protein
MNMPSLALLIYSACTYSVSPQPSVMSDNTIQSLKENLRIEISRNMAMRKHTFIRPLSPQAFNPHNFDIANSNSQKMDHQLKSMTHNSQTTFKLHCLLDSACSVASGLACHDANHNSDLQTEGTVQRPIEFTTRPQFSFEVI